MKTPDTKQTKVPQNQDTPSIPSIRARMKVGDDQIVAKVTGYSEDYVRRCMKESRNNKLIVLVSRRLVENRDEFIKSTQEIVELIKAGTYH